MHTSISLQQRTHFSDKIKQQSRLDPKKYGGYNSLKGAHFALIECKDKKGSAQRRIVQVPIIAKDNIEKYVAENYDDARVILPVIKYKSLIKLNGFPMHISRKGGETAIGFYHAIQAIISNDRISYLKKVTKISQRDKKQYGKYNIDAEKDGVSDERNLRLLDTLLEKLEAYGKMPELGGKISEIKNSRTSFTNLDLRAQCLALTEFIKILSCGPETANLLSFVPKAGTVGKGKFNDNILNYDSVKLINQSPTGLYEEVIDLKTVQPKNCKRDKK